MKKLLLVVVLTAGIIPALPAQTCSTCGGSGATVSSGDDTSPSLNISLGTLQYGEPAGELSFSGSFPIPELVSPASLQFNSPLSDLITVVTNGDGSLRQISAPQALADIPVPSTTNGYVVNFYYPSQITGQTGGVYQLSGSPFVAWMITNADPNGAGQLQISESMSGSLLKQWTYTYSTNTGAWTVWDLAGVGETMTLTNLSSTTYEVINSVQYTNGSPARIVAKTYQDFSWGSGLVQIAAGDPGAPELTTYTYYDSAPYTNGNSVPVRTVVNPDGSWVWYAAYGTNGMATNVYSSFGDITLAYATNNVGGGARQTFYTYDPVAAGVSGSGDNGSCNAVIPRRVINYVQGQEISRSYTVFPSVSERLDIQCTTPGGAWNASGNLVTTNYFYTSGPNQFALEVAAYPDGTITTYNYITNGLYQTNITVTGQPNGNNGSSSIVVDGVSNVVVLNQAGYSVSSASYDVRSGALLSSDTYGNFDSNSRPQQVTHLDGTTEYFSYDCCGLDTTVNKDGVSTQYLYDPARRQIGYEQFYNTNGITYTNRLDAADRTLQSIRVGTDNSHVTMSQSAYDQAGELIVQTNALNGVTFYTRSNDPGTGGLIRTTVNPDGGTITNYYYLDGSVKKAVGTAVHGQAYGYGYATDVNGNTCTYTVETNLNADGTLSSEWTKTFTDMAGRTTEILYADGHYSRSFYNSLGQLSKQIDPDGVITLYQYNAKGELAYTAVDMNQNGNIDFSGTDRITQTTNDVSTDHGSTVQRSRTFVWLDGQSTGTLVSATETSTDGLNRWQTQYRDASTPVNSTNTVSYGSGSRTVVNSAPDGSYTLSLYSYGRLTSSTRYDSTSAQIGGTTYSYDAHGRQYQVTDARNGTTTYGYNNADQVTTVTTPDPGNGSPETTTTYYDNMEQAYEVIQPDGTTVNTAYLPTRELALQYGSRTYPVAYSYDYAGRMKTMTNWSDYSGHSGPRVTTWSYDSQRGWLTQKTYPDGHGPSYTYTDAGRLKTRVWARGITTTYKYDTASSLTNVIYSDSTPGVTNVYDRLGRLGKVSWTNIADTLTYNLANELLSESYSGGILNGLSVTNGYDADLRRAALAALNGGTHLVSDTYGYDNASRLQTVNDGNNNSATYSYVANSPLVSQITFKSNSVTQMTTTKQYDYLNRLTQISSQPSGSGAPPVSFNYSYNTANQRTKDVLADGSYWMYQYDSLGQATNGVKHFRDGSLVPGQQFGYLFDDIGNRKQTTAGGDSAGANLRLASYTVNNLNQITQRDYPGTNDVIGAALATNSVTVNGQTAWRKGEYFWSTIKSNNTAAAQWEGVSVVSGSFTNNGNLFVPKTPEQFSYDPDGNLTNDGRFAYTWDGENRLIAMTNNTGVGPRYGLKFAYDAQGRRIQKFVATNGVPVYTNRFLYDGWNLIAELNPASSLVRSYVWGNDLSGSQQGAGGVGGLLEVSCHGTSTTNCFPAYDGNGNVAALVNAADGTIAANYEYGPFGELIRQTGPMAKANPIRWSTKYQDDESDLLYYGYRYYDSSTGRWPNRDPLEEVGNQAFQHLNWDKPQQPSTSMPSISKTLFKGHRRFYSTGSDDLPVFGNSAKQATDFINYQFCRNDPMNRYDIDGRADVPIDAPGCGFYAVQVGAGLLLGLLDSYLINEECKYVAGHQDTESFRTTPLTKAATIVNIAAVVDHCPQGGQVYLHVWWDKTSCECKHNYVIICNACASGA